MAVLGDRGPFLGGTDSVVEGAGGVAIQVTALAPEPVSRDRPPVVLLHGLSQQRRFWGPVVRRLVGERLAVVDLRGHGDSGRPDDGPYDVPTCAADVVAVLDALGWPQAVVVGHSWGASVAVQVAAQAGDRVAAVVALDGGTAGPADLGPREEVRAALEPPRLGLPEAELLALLRAGALAPWWTEEVEQALLPTFEAGPDGLVRTRIGFDRHMQVLDGLIDHDAAAALAAVTCPAWVVWCEPTPGGDARPGDHGAHREVADGWARARRLGYERAAALLSRPRLMRWAGAVHDVPLQWPSLVAGLVRTVVDEQEQGAA